jgi:hypothetical protein
MDRHPSFVWNEYNIENIQQLLNRKDWKKSIRSIDDFDFRWKTNGETSLYGQALRVALPYMPCEECSGKAMRKSSGVWTCEGCIAAERLAKKQEAEEVPRTIMCACRRRLVIPMGWDAAKYTDKDGRTLVKCAMEKGGCGAFHQVSASILAVVCPGFKSEPDYETL